MSLEMDENQVAEYHNPVVARFGGAHERELQGFERVAKRQVEVDWRHWVDDIRFTLRAGEPTIADGRELPLLRILGSRGIRRLGRLGSFTDFGCGRGVVGNLLRQGRRRLIRNQRREYQTGYVALAH